MSEENHRPAASHQQTLPHNVVSSTPRHERVRTHNFSDDRHSQIAVNQTTIHHDHDDPYLKIA